LPIVSTCIGFAKHFEGTKGIKLVKPPVNILRFDGAIWQLTSNEQCESNIASALVETYKNPVRPGVSEKVVQMFDKAFTYQLYVDLIRHFFDTGEIVWQSGMHSWPEVLESRKNQNVINIS
jgi:hypothetical protein